MSTDDDSGVPLATALAQIATDAERAAVAAWDAKTPATQAYFLAWRANHEDRTPATTATPARWEPDGRRSESPDLVKPVFIAALEAQQACARRLTDELRAGAWTLSYLPREAGSDRKTVDVHVWRDLEVVVRPPVGFAHLAAGSLSLRQILEAGTHASDGEPMTAAINKRVPIEPRIAVVNGATPPPWLIRPRGGGRPGTGHRGSLLLQPGGAPPAAVASLPPPTEPELSVPAVPPRSELELFVPPPALTDIEKAAVACNDWIEKLAKATMATAKPGDTSKAVMLLRARSLFGQVLPNQAFEDSWTAHITKADHPWSRGGRRKTARAKPPEQSC